MRSHCNMTNQAVETASLNVMGKKSFDTTVFALSPFSFVALRISLEWMIY